MRLRSPIRSPSPVRLLKNRGPRIALYSHDTMGLGHMRRHALIAQALAESGLNPRILLIAGARQAQAFALPRRTDCLSLPALHKVGDGQYRSRTLNVSLKRAVALRAQTIRAAIEMFNPDVFIVDQMPRGVCRELEPTLELLRSRPRTRCVLGLRDVLDDPAVVQHEWRVANNEQVIREQYAAVWLYGDPRVYDTARECRLAPEIAARTFYTGYLDQRRRLAVAPLADAVPGVDGPIALCAVGGGHDGARLAEAFADAPMPPGTTGVVITGPFMPEAARERLQRRAVHRPDLRIVEFVPEPLHLVQRAAHVVVMGGYNTVSEVLSFEKRALVVPRLQPRREQVIRAERLRDLGLIDVLLPDAATADSIGRWLAASDRRQPASRSCVDLNGLTRIPALIGQLIGEPSLALQAPVWSMDDGARSRAHAS